MSVPAQTADKAVGIHAGLQLLCEDARKGVGPILAALINGTLSNAEALEAISGALRSIINVGAEEDAKKAFGLDKFPVPSSLSEKPKQRIEWLLLASLVPLLAVQTLSSIHRELVITALQVIRQSLGLSEDDSVFIMAPVAPQRTRAFNRAVLGILESMSQFLGCKDLAFPSDCPVKMSAFKSTKSQEQDPIWTTLRFSTLDDVIAVLCNLISFISNQSNATGCSGYMADEELKMGILGLASSVVEIFLPNGVIAQRERSGTRPLTANSASIVQLYQACCHCVLEVVPLMHEKSRVFPSLAKSLMIILYHHVMSVEDRCAEWMASAANKNHSSKIKIEVEDGAPRSDAPSAISVKEYRKELPLLAVIEDLIARSLMVVLDRTFESFPDTVHLRETRLLAVELLFSDELLLLKNDASGQNIHRVLFMLLAKLVPSGAFPDPLKAITHLLKHYGHVDLDLLIHIIYVTLIYWRNMGGSETSSDNLPGTSTVSVGREQSQAVLSVKRSLEETEPEQPHTGSMDVKGKRVKRDSPSLNSLSVDSTNCSSIVSYSQPSQRPNKQSDQSTKSQSRRSPSGKLLGMLKALISSPSFNHLASQASRGIQPPLSVEGCRAAVAIVHVWTKLFKEGSPDAEKDAESLTQLMEDIGKSYILWSLSPGMQNVSLNTAYLESSYPLILDLIAPMAILRLNERLKVLLICLASGPWFPDIAKPNLWRHAGVTMDLDVGTGEEQLARGIRGITAGSEVLSRLEDNSEILQFCESFRSQKSKALRILSTLPFCPQLEVWRGEVILGTLNNKWAEQQQDDALKIHSGMKIIALEALAVLSTHCADARSTVEAATSGAWLTFDDETEETKRTLSFCIGVIACGYCNIERDAGPKYTYDPLSRLFVQEWTCSVCDQVAGDTSCGATETPPLRLDPRFLNAFAFKRLIPSCVSVESRLALLRGLYRVFCHIDLLDEDGRALDLRGLDFGKFLLAQLSDSDETLRSAGGDIVELIAMKAGSTLADDPLGQSNLHEILVRICEAIIRGYDSRLRGQARLWPIRLSQRIMRHLPEDYSICQDLLIKLIDQAFGEEKMIRAGFVFDQMASIAKDKGVSNYRLVRPQIEYLCARVIEKLEAGQDRWLEVVFYPWTGLSATRFLQQNLSELVPKMILLNNRALIEKVAGILNEMAGGLCIRQIDHILAAIFLELTEAHVQPCIELLRSLIVQIEQDSGRPAHSLDIVELTLLSTEGLVCCLSFELGNEDFGKCDQAKKMIEIVASYSWQRAKQGQQTQGKSPERQSVAVFLRRHVLAIMSEVNNAILDTHTVTHRTKAKYLRSLFHLVKMLHPIQRSVLSQIFSPLNIALDVRGLRIHALHSINMIVREVPGQLDVMLSHIVQTLVKHYDRCNEMEREAVLNILEHLLSDNQSGLKSVLADVGSLPDREEFSKLNEVLRVAKAQAGFEEQLRRLIVRSSSEHQELAEQALVELRDFLLLHSLSVLERSTTKERQLDPLMQELIQALLSAIGRFRGLDGPVPRLCAECLGAIGAIDPAKLSTMRLIPAQPILVNFVDPEEARNFVCQLIEVQLVGKSRSIGDIRSESHWAYTLQTLLSFCGITKGVLSADLSKPSRLSSRPLPIKSAEDRWRAFPRHVQEVLELLIDAKYTKTESAAQPAYQSPICRHVDTFKEWLTVWTLVLIGKVQGQYAKEIFQACKHVVPYDTNTTLYILPHLVLVVLIDGLDKDRKEIVEEMVAVLGSDNDWRQSSAEQNIAIPQHGSGELSQLGSQTVFALFDHITKWIQSMKGLSTKSSTPRSFTTTAEASQRNIRQHEVAALDAVQGHLTSISNEVIAMAAFRTKAYARSLLNYEQFVRDTRQQRRTDGRAIQPMYERHQEIYAHLEEPDGMEGISGLITSGTSTQNLLQSESAGRWNEAQAYYELELQKDPGNLDHHKGLYKCLENLGHYNSLLFSVEGDIKSNPDWEQQLTDWRVASAWKMQNWESLETALSRSVHPSFEVGLGQLFLDLRDNRLTDFETNLQQVRSMLIAPLAAASMESYSRAYEHIARLHMLHDLELAFACANPGARSASVAPGLRNAVTPADRVYTLQPALEKRFEAMSPSFRLREQVASLQRVAFYGIRIPTTEFQEDLSFLKDSCGRLWLRSARAARKSGNGQVSFSAMLNAESLSNSSASLERAKYEFIHSNERQAIKTIDMALSSSLPSSAVGSRVVTGSRLRQTSSGGHRALAINMDLRRVVDHVVDPNSAGYIRAKAHLLRTRWMDRSNLVSPSDILEGYRQATVECERWEKGYYVAGQYFLKLYDNSRRFKHRGPTLGYVTNACRLYGKALTLGPKYLYQALPRLLTFWLELGHQAQAGRANIPATLQASTAAEFQNVNKLMENLAELLPEYMFLSAFPQIISRMCHKNADAFAVLQHIIVNVVLAFPDQAIWQMVSVSRSIVQERKRVCNKILDSIHLQPQIGAAIIDQIKEALDLCDNLITLCMAPVPDKVERLSLEKHFPRVYQQLRQNYNVTVPCQRTLWPTIPETSATMSSHQPFENHLPKISRFMDEVEVMTSLQRPRKITIVGSDGLHYTFLCKPKDDLRKDAKVMEFNGLVNMLLRRSRKANRKNLYIRTYAVVPLNEECGLIEWVYNTITFRSIMSTLYKTNSLTVPQTAEIKRILDHEDHVRMFVKDLLPKFPTIFYKWLLEISQEPTAWFETRLRYTRTTAVMSMVGHIMGLGDRHGENLLFDHRNGEIVHVDFNCLFEQGKTFPKPEKVPFRLTQNMVDGMGLSGYDGVFRLACEQTLSVFRDNVESLVSVLEGFLHDPLVEWAKSKRRGQQTQQDPLAAAGALGGGLPGGNGVFDSLGEATGAPNGADEARARLRSRAEAAKAKADAAAVEAADTQQNEKAQAILNVIKRKLNGSENTNSYVLSVQGQVEELLQAATSPDNLAKMYIGWSAYL